MAGIPTAQKLLEQAQSGNKLTTKERRHVIAWLQAVSHDDIEATQMTNSQLAELFGVTERTIRMDKQDFRKDKAKLIREDEVSLIIADIAIDYERQIRDIEKSKTRAQKGSMAYLNHCTAVMKLRLDTIRGLQDLGYYPKNLGTVTVQNWDFKAIVDPTTGYVNTEQVPTIQAEIVEPSKLGDGNGETRINYEYTVSTEEDREYSGQPRTASDTSEAI